MPVACVPRSGGRAPPCLAASTGTLSLGKVSPVQGMGQLEGRWIAAAIIPAALVTVLFFFDHNVSAQLAQQVGSGLSTWQGDELATKQLRLQVPPKLQKRLVQARRCTAFANSVLPWPCPPRLCRRSST